jgi:hypothetical protein
MTLDAQERAQLLSAWDVNAKATLIEVLDPERNVVIADIADRVLSLEVEHNSYGAADETPVHRMVRLATDFELEWGHHHIRPWVTVTGGGLSDTQLLGTFALTSTPQPRDSDRPEYAVQGFDLLYRMKQPVDASFTAPRDRPYLATVADLCAQQDLVFRHPPGPATAPTVPRSWTVTDDVTWLDVANGLLAAVGFQELACDVYGDAYSEPRVDPKDKAVAWGYDATAADSAVLANEGVMEHDYTQAPNRWVAYRVDPDLGPPQPGDGIATVNNRTRGPTSQARRGIVITRKEQVDAPDQAHLLAHARAMRDADGEIHRLLTITTKPNIWHGHLDVVHVLDPRTDTNGRMSSLRWVTTVTRETAQTAHWLREVAILTDET